MTDPADRLEYAMDDLYHGYMVHVGSHRAAEYVQEHADRCGMDTEIISGDGGYTVERVGEKPVRRGA